MRDSYREDEFLATQFIPDPHKEGDLDILQKKYGKPFKRVKYVTVEKAESINLPNLGQPGQPEINQVPEFRNLPKSPELLTQAFRSVEGLYRTSFADDPITQERIRHAVEVTFNAMSEMAARPDLNGQLEVKLPDGRTQLEGAPVEELISLLEEAAAHPNAPDDEKQFYLQQVTALKDHSRSYFDIHYPKSDGSMHHPDYPDLEGRSDEQHLRTEQEAYYLSLPQHRAYRETLTQKYPQYAEVNPENDYRLAMEIMRTRRELIPQPKNSSIEVEKLKTEFRDNLGMKDLKLVFAPNIDPAVLKERMEILKKFFLNLQLTPEDLSKVDEWTYLADDERNVHIIDGLVKYTIIYRRIKDETKWDEMKQDMKSWLDRLGTDHKASQTEPAIANSEPRKSRIDGEVLKGEVNLLTETLKDKFGIQIEWLDGSGIILKTKKDALENILKIAEGLQNLTPEDWVHVPIKLHSQKDLSRRQMDELDGDGLAFSAYFMASSNAPDKLTQFIKMRVGEISAAKKLAEKYPNLKLPSLEGQKAERINILFAILGAAEAQGVDMGEFDEVQAGGIKTGVQNIKNRKLMLNTKITPTENVKAIVDAYNAYHVDEGNAETPPAEPTVKLPVEDSDNQPEIVPETLEDREKREINEMVVKLKQANEVLIDVCDAVPGIAKLDKEYHKIFNQGVAWMEKDEAGKNTFFFEAIDKKTTKQSYSKSGKQLEFGVNKDKLEIFNDWYRVDDSYIGESLPVYIKDVLRVNNVDKDELQMLFEQVESLALKYGIDEQVSRIEKILG